MGVFADTGARFVNDFGGYALAVDTPLGVEAIIFPYIRIGIGSSEANKLWAERMNNGFCKSVGDQSWPWTHFRCYDFHPEHTRSQCMPILRSASTIQVI